MSKFKELLLTLTIQAEDHRYIWLEEQERGVENSIHSCQDQVNLTKTIRSVLILFSLEKLLEIY